MSPDRRGAYLEELRRLQRSLREAIETGPRSLLLEGGDPERLRESLGDVEDEIRRELLRLEHDAPRVDAGVFSIH